jgi:hypothetical protein
MNITINIIEVASRLADDDLMNMQNSALEKHPHDLPFPNGIVKEIVEDGQEIVVYTEEAQDMFNERYDYWFDFLLEQNIGEDE